MVTYKQCTVGNVVYIIKNINEYCNTKQDVIQDICWGWEPVLYEALATVHSFLIPTLYLIDMPTYESVYTSH